MYKAFTRDTTLLEGILIEHLPKLSKKDPYLLSTTLSNSHFRNYVSLAKTSFVIIDKVQLEDQKLTIKSKIHKSTWT